MIDDYEDAESVEMCDQRAHPRPRPRRRTDHDGAVGRAVDQPGCESRRHERAWHERAPELLEHHDGLRHAEAEPAVLGGHPYREDARGAELLPVSGIDHTRPPLGCAQTFQREMSGAQGPRPFC